MKRIVICLFCVFIPGTFSLSAQDAITTTEQLIADIFEQYAAESEVDIDYDTFYEELMYCAENPVNLNHTTKEELEKLRFLSVSQVENILTYCYQFGKIQSIYELQLIEGLDMTDIRRMLPFVNVGESGETIKKIYWHDLLQYGKHELFFRLDQGVETKEGYRFLPEEDEGATETNAKNYLGNSLYHSLRYRYHLKDRIFIGITAEKDAGEQFLGSTHTGYDSYSGYALVNDIGIMKSLVIGDFRANFGMGLVLRPEFGMGKSSYVLNVTSRNSGLKKYGSTDETNFFRGAGATVQLGKFDLTAFYSNKMIDGDTVNGVFSSLDKTGLHRTISELSKKHTVSQQVMGGNATYTFSNFQIGLTAVHTILNSKLEPEKSAYNYFYFSGNQQTTAGIHYRMRWYKLNLFGETAMTGNGSIATINGFIVTPISQVSLVTLHRYYSPEFDTFYATAFSETSRINNESGWYLGTEIRPFRRWKIAAYADSYRFVWPKYGIDAPSVGADYLLQIDYAAQRNIVMFWRFKYEEKENNLSGTSSVMPLVVPIQKTSLRYNLSYSFRNFSFKNTLEGNLVRQADDAPTHGIIASQDLSYTFSTIPVVIDVRYQFFDAVNYENRFYSYEKDVLYAFSIPMYFGLGSRYYLNLRYNLNKSLSIWFKIAQTVYADDRESLSTGNETIYGNRKTDIRFLLKWNF
ncbi:MAG: helix-hairpin-helix domain-containing protein [Paludibacter sp.]|nr:helix-hairpin-helix domain-containing protein [Paludibacter sp.]